jgi:hypothetical protein
MVGLEIHRIKRELFPASKLRDEDFVLKNQSNFKRSGPDGIQREWMKQNTSFMGWANI